MVASSNTKMALFFIKCVLSDTKVGMLRANALHNYVRDLHDLVKGYIHCEFFRVSGKFEWLIIKELSFFKSYIWVTRVSVMK